MTASQPQRVPTPGEPQRGPALAPVEPLPPRDLRYDWAAERTLLAWVRTGIAIMMFGFVVARAGTMAQLAGIEHRNPDGLVATVGGALIIALGVLVNAVAAHRFLRRHGALLRGELAEASPRAPIVLAAAVGAVGLVLAASVCVWLLAG